MLMYVCVHVYMYAAIYCFSLWKASVGARSVGRRWPDRPTELLGADLTGTTTGIGRSPVSSVFAVCRQGGALLSVWSTVLPGCEHAVFPVSTGFPCEHARMRVLALALGLLVHTLPAPNGSIGNSSK